MSKPWDYLEAEPKPDAPISDNPSGLYCRACRGIGVWHCAHPEDCGGMQRMRPLAASTPTPESPANG